MMRSLEASSNDRLSSQRYAGGARDGWLNGLKPRRVPADGRPSRRFESSSVLQFPQSLPRSSYAHTVTLQQEEDDRRQDDPLHHGASPTRMTGTIGITSEYAHRLAQCTVCHSKAIVMSKPVVRYAISAPALGAMNQREF